MIAIHINDIITKICPQYRVGVIMCDVQNTAKNNELQQEIAKVCSHIKQTQSFESIKQQYVIAATREAYKKADKDPNRYRPATEQLLRRIVKFGDIYYISTLVDVVNLIAIQSGYSIGGFDMSAVQPPITLGLGMPNEEYYGIGRGLLNIENLPVWRDQKGGIGTPTSDEERTKIHEHTSSFLLLINGFSGNEGLQETVDLSVSLLKKYVCAQSIETCIV